METIDLYKKYKRFGVSPKILSQYRDEDASIQYNAEDPDLDTITVELPKTPTWNKIDGFGLPAKDQMFKRVVVPQKLVDLQWEPCDDGTFLTQDEIWEKLDEQPDYYKDEIKFIKDNTK